MIFEHTYRSMNDRITPSDTLVSDTLTRIQQGYHPKHRLRRGTAVALAAVIALGSTAAALHITDQLPALYAAVSRFLSPVEQSCTPVSYTHLDVYKRQVFPQKNGQSPCIRAG